MAGRDISIVVPIYNEANNILPLVSRINRELGRYDWEILFVDDNSPDRGSDVARNLSLDDERDRLILRVADRGLANACIQGLLSAKGDVLCVMDGDGQHDPAYVPDLVEPIRKGDYDIVSAARTLDESSNDSALSPWRVKLSKLGNGLSRHVLGRKVQDPLTGFFAIRRESFLPVAPALRDPGFKILLDILAVDRHLRHLETPFTFQSRQHGESKLDSFAAWQFATFLLSRLTQGIIPARLISFLAVGGSGVFVHLALLLASLPLTGSFAISQFAGAVAAVTSNFLLNNQLTFRDQRLRGARLFTGYLEFLVISSVGVAANVSMATYTYNVIASVAWVAAFAGIALDTIWKYAVSSRLVWR